MPPLATLSSFWFTSLLDEVLVEFSQNVWIEEGLLGTLCVAGVEIANFATSLVSQEAFAKIVILLRDLKICISLSAFFGEAIIIPWIAITNLFFGESHLRCIWIVGDLDTENPLGLRT